MDILYSSSHSTCSVVSPLWFESTCEEVHVTLSSVPSGFPLDFIEKVCVPWKTRNLLGNAGKRSDRNLEKGANLLFKFSFVGGFYKSSVLFFHFLLQRLERTSFALICIADVQRSSNCEDVLPPCALYEERKQGASWLREMQIRWASVSLQGADFILLHGCLMGLVKWRMA